MQPPGLEVSASPGAVLYIASPYQSHARAARDNRLMIGQENLTQSLDDAEIVILHLEPHDYESIFKEHPNLKSKYVIAYCVWEADILPDRFVRSLSLVDEVWTCSQYCARIFARYHQSVICIPHAIHRNCEVEAADIVKLERELRLDQSNQHFIFIARLWDKRKNASLLLDTFARLADSLPHLRLIVKVSPEETEFTPSPNVLYLSRHLSEPEMNALYSLSSAYVSPHHSEGWGYTLSDAMLMGTPVIATGYSGNLDFMTSDSAFLIETLEDYVRPADEYYLFDRSMKWGYPDPEDLVRKITMLYERRNDAAVLTVTRRAQQVVKDFDYPKVSARIHKRLAEIANKTRQDACKRM